jgi:hypothetical protein
MDSWQWSQNQQAKAECLGGTNAICDGGSQLHRVEIGELTLELHGRVSSMT